MLYPNVIFIDSHSYLPLVDIIQHCLANNNHYYDIKNYTKEFDTSNVKYIWDSNHVKDVIKKMHK